MAKDQEEIWGEDEIKEIKFVLWLTGGWYCQPRNCAINQEKNIEPLKNFKLFGFQ